MVHGGTVPAQKKGGGVIHRPQGRPPCSPSGGRWATRGPSERATRARPESPPRAGTHAPPSSVFRFTRQRATGKLRRCNRAVEDRYRTCFSFCRTDYCHRKMARKTIRPDPSAGSWPDGTLGRCSLSPVNRSPGTGRDTCGGSGRRSPASPTEVGSTAERRVGRADVAGRPWKHRGRGANRPGRASNVRRRNL